jgi:hypothetical protein
MKKSVFIIPLLLLGCGSDNKSNDKNDTKKNIYSLEKITSLSPGTLYASELANTDTGGYGFIEIENKAEVVMNGVMVTPQHRHLTFTDQRHGSSNMAAPVWESTFYIDSATKNVIAFETFSSRVGMGTRITCTSSSPHHLPTQIEIGDSGIIPGFNCDNNISFPQSNWTATDAGNNNINVNIPNKSVDTSGAMIDQNIVYTLDINGSIVSFSIDDRKSFSDN